MLSFANVTRATILYGLFSVIQQYVFPISSSEYLTASFLKNHQGPCFHKKSPDKDSVSPCHTFSLHIRHTMITYTLI